MEGFQNVELWVNQLELLVEKSKRRQLSLSELKDATQTARKLHEFLLIEKIKKEHVEPSSPVEGVFNIKEPLLRNEPRVNEGDQAGYEKKNDVVVSEEKAENQTSLIEIIEEIQEDQSINERIAHGQTKETLADKHAKRPIADLEKAMGINQKFSFIKHLFDQDKEAFETAVTQLNACASFLEADDFIQNHLIKKYQWDEEALHVIKFVDLVERRYLPVPK